MRMPLSAAIGGSTCAQAAGTVSKLAAITAKAALQMELMILSPRSVPRRGVPLLDHHSENARVSEF